MLMVSLTTCILQILQYNTEELDTIRQHNKDQARIVHNLNTTH